MSKPQSFTLNLRTTAITATPGVMGGAMRIDNHGHRAGTVKLSVVLGMLMAGESLDRIARWYDIDVKQVRLAIRALKSAVERAAVK